jgi:hypothetical protein
VSAAMTACGQTRSLTKEGSLMGPVAPSVAKALAARRGSPRGGGITRTPPTQPRHPAGASSGRGRPFHWRPPRGRGHSTPPKSKSTAARRLDAGAGKPAGEGSG